MLRYLASSLFAASLLTTACAVDDGKGVEDDALDLYENKDDSFKKPTLHGQLIFGPAQNAQLTDDEQFHGWDFSLSDDAEVELTTELLTRNLDTVMYLYKKNSDGAFGRFLFKNDDAGADDISSKIAEELEAGDYRVVVKGFKSSLRGSFNLIGSCTGDGCPVVASCNLNSFESLPGASASNDSCGEQFSAALIGEEANGGSTTLRLEERCDLPEIARIGLEYYVDYWGDIGDFDEIFDFSGEGAEVELDWTIYSTGAALVMVDAGGDEAAMDFLFNVDGELISHYQHNQSPDYSQYCDGGDIFIEEEDCYFDMLDTLPHDADDEEEIDQTVDEDRRDGIPFAVDMAYSHYKEELGLSAAKDVKITGTIWDIGGNGHAGQLVLKASGSPRYTYDLSSSDIAGWFYNIRRGTGEELEHLCIEVH